MRQRRMSGYTDGKTLKLFTDEQKSILYEKFSINGYPSSSEIDQIAREIDDGPERVKVMGFILSIIFNITAPLYKQLAFSG